MFVPAEAAAGGVFIGVACGLHMYLSGKIAGNSGALKAVLLLRDSDWREAFFLGGLLGGGSLVGFVMPGRFEAVPLDGCASLLWRVLCGMAVGVGTTLGNGCTSGHGLCGLSRLSTRSLAAVPTFMTAAVLSASATATDVAAGPVPLFVPPSEADGATLRLAATLALGMAGSLVALRRFVPGAQRKAGAADSRATALDLATDAWVGACFAIGLSIGGMTRPSVVTGALQLAVAHPHIDLTLWVLFVVALVTTFVLYRAAERSGNFKANAVCDNAKAAAKGVGVDRRLVTGAALFGLGWGATGLCPGPHLVGIAAAPFAGVDVSGSLAALCGLAAGIKAAGPLGAAVF